MDGPYRITTNEELCIELMEEISNGLDDMAAKQGYVRLQDKPWGIKYMPELPKCTNPIWEAIEEVPVIDEPPRPYLGYSILGKECARYLWYSFRWAFKNTITKRQQRLFNRGHTEEAIIVKDLENAGVSCRNVLDKQIEVVGVMGHVKGHPDGECSNVPGAEKTDHLLEMKTSADKYFTQFIKVGCKEANWTYYVQQQCYMMKTLLTRSLFVVTNKNNESRHYERIHYDKEVAEMAEERAFDIVVSKEPPPGIQNNSLDWYKCKMCDARYVCHGIEKPIRNCRTCRFSQVKDNGKWGCSIYEGDIPEEFQRIGCKDRYQPRI